MPRVLLVTRRASSQLRFPLMYMERFVSPCSQGVTLETRLLLSKRGFWKSRVDKAACYSVGLALGGVSVWGLQSLPKEVMQECFSSLAWLLEEQRKGKRACSMMGSVGWRIEYLMLQEGSLLWALEVFRTGGWLVNTVKDPGSAYLHISYIGSLRLTKTRSQIRLPWNSIFVT